MNFEMILFIFASDFCYPTYKMHVEYIDSLIAKCNELEDKSNAVSNSLKL